MVDDVDVDRPALALDEQLGHEQRRDRQSSSTDGSISSPRRGRA